MWKTLGPCHSVLRICVIGLGLSIVAAWSCSVSANPSVLYDVELRHVPRLKPGTIVEKGPPQGWSHLIIKNQPFLNRAEADKVHPLAARLAKALFSAMVAHVDQDPADPARRFRLRAVAVGLGTNIDGRDVIISSQTLNQQSDEFGFIYKTVVSRTEDELAQWAQVARSPSMVIMDVPCWMVRNGIHQRVSVRNAVLVNPNDGGLVTLVWVVAPQDPRQNRAKVDPMRWLQPNLVYEYPLHVDESQVIAGVPTSTAFAMHDLPEGFELQVPQALRPIAGQRRLTPQAAQQIESELWRIVGVVTERASGAVQQAQMLRIGESDPSTGVRRAH